MVPWALILALMVAAPAALLAATIAWVHYTRRW